MCDTYKRDESVTPIQQPIRRIPFHTRQKVDNELKRLLDLDYIESIRLCLNMRRANQAILRERNTIPTVSNLLTELHGARYFTRLT